MRQHLLLACATLAVLASPAYAQMGGGGMRGQGHGQGQGGRGGQDGGDDSGDKKKPETPTRPVAPILPVGMRLNGALNIFGENKSAEGGSVTVSRPDLSAIFVSRGGGLVLKNSTLQTSGPVSLVDDSRGAGLNSALLVNQSSRAVVTGGKIETLGLGANGAYVDGPGSQLSLQNLTISTQATNAYGVEAHSGATLTAATVTINTMGDHAPAVANRRGQPMQLTDLTLHTAASDSPLVLAQGDINATNIKGRAERDNGVSVNGPVHVTLQTPDLSADGYAIAVQMDAAGAMGAAGRPDGAQASAPMGPEPDSGDSDDDKSAKAAQVRPITNLLSNAPGNDRRADIQVKGGTLSGDRAVLLVSNAKAHIVLTGVTLSSESGVILRAAAGQNGDLGRNGGDVDLELHGETVKGDFNADVISNIRVTLNDQSHLTGKASPDTDITLDTGSDWTLSDDTHVGKLIVTGLDKPDAITNIQSGGHTLYYDPHRNPWLAHKTWPLPGGGQLTPDL